MKARQRQQQVPDPQPGFLRRARLRKQVTRDSYDESWKSFISFCVDSDIIPAARTRFVTMHQLDTALEAFGEHLFLEGLSKYVLTCALQNVNLVYPCWPTSARTNFPLTKASKKGWSNLEPGTSKDPCPLEIAFWIAYDLVQHNMAYFAAAVVLGFDTYVRPGMLCQLTSDNVIPPARRLHQKYSHWTLLLRPEELRNPSKANQFNDSLVVGSTGREWIGELLGRIYTLQCDPGDSRLFSFTLNRFEKEFKNSTKRLKISHLKLSPHCLRHGGASHDYLFGIRSLVDVQARGCWATYESVRRYAKHGRISKQLALLTPEQQNSAKQATLDLPRLLLKQLR